jgi:hypothetical protein
MEESIWKKLRMLTVNIRVSTVNVRRDGNREDSEAETDDRNGEKSKTGEDE